MERDRLHRHQSKPSRTRLGRAPKPAVARGRHCGPAATPLILVLLLLFLLLLLIILLLLLLLLLQFRLQLLLLLLLVLRLLILVLRLLPELLHHLG